MNPQGALAHLHKRKADAGCDVAPDRAGGAKLFVPFTPEQLGELESMGLELENHQRVPASEEAWMRMVTKKNPSNITRLCRSCVTSSLRRMQCTAGGEKGAGGHNQRKYRRRLFAFFAEKSTPAI